jgi:DHA1 family tetracycline resistance protein-like MFS transporter
MKGNKTASLTFIFITILIDIIGIGIIIPIIPDLIRELGDMNIEDASQIGGWLMASYALMQFFFAPAVGLLSDKYGRRTILFISLFGMGLDYILHAVAPTLIWLFVGRVIAGVFGASITTANAYIADISDPKDRAKNFGMVGVAFGVGFALGPFLGGVLSEWGTRIPFYAAAGLSILNLIYGIFVLPESLPKEKRRDISWKDANPIGALTFLKKHKELMGFVSVYFLLNLAGHAVHSTWNFFTMDQFAWTAKQVGYSLAIVGILVATVQGGVIGLVVPKLGDRRSVLIGFGFWTFGMILFSLATEGWMMYVFLIPYCLGGIAGPTMQGIISNQVQGNEQGELQGALTSLASMTSVAGPILMTTVFRTFAEEETAPVHFPGAAFGLGAILLMFCIYLTNRHLKGLSNLNPGTWRVKSQ